MPNYDGDIVMRVDLEPGDIKSTARELSKTVEDIFKRAESAGPLKNSFKSLLANLDKSYNRADKLLGKMIDIESTKVPTEEYKELSKQFDIAKQRATEYANVINDMRKEGYSEDALNGYYGKLREAEAEIRQVQDAMEAMKRAGTASIPLLETDEGIAAYEDVSTALNEVNNQLTINTRRAAESGQIISQASGKYKDFKTVTASLKSNLTALSKLLLKIATYALKTAFNLSKMAGHGIISGIKKLSSALSGVSKNTNFSTDSFKKGLRMLLQYGIGVRSLYFLVKKLRSALKEGISNLAQYSQPFNSVISSFLSALTRLKNAFATAFAPIINVIAPIITTFINLISEAVTRVGMLIAVLTGQSTFIKAKAVQEDYAASLDGAAGSAGKATKAAKEYQKTIAGFDDVEILKDPNKDSSGGSGGSGGGGGGGVSPQDMFETVNLPESISNFAEKIKEAWKNADFTEIGEIVGEKLAEALNNIPWDKIQELAGKFGKSFATFINGVVSVTELADALGKTIGEAINTVFTGLNSFVGNLEFDKIGNFIAEAMNKSIDTIHWNTIADTIAKTANGVFKLADTWANKFEFGKLGTSISNTVKKTLDDIKWDNAKSAFSSLCSGLATTLNKIITPSTFSSVGKAIAGALNTAISGAHSFIGTIEWKNWGTAIATGVNKFSKDFNAKELGITFGELVGGLLDMLTTAIEKINWETVGGNVKDALANVGWSDLFKKLGKLVEVSADALGEFLDGLLKGLPEALYDWIINCFKEVWKGILEGDALSSGGPTKELALSGKVNTSGIETPEIGVVASIESFVDKILGKDKVINNFTATVEEKKDEIKNKIISNFTAGLQTLHDGIAPDKKNVNGVTANANHMNSNGIPDKDKTVEKGTIKANKVDSKNVPASDRIVKDGVVRLSKTTDGMSASYKKNNPVKGLSGILSKVVSTGKKTNINVDSVTANRVKLKDNEIGVKLKVLNATKLKQIAGNAKGGAYFGGAWHSIAQYASGGVPNHGTVFVAGEAGVETVGHIGNRTEVLNQSQMAAVMQSAVINGMAASIKVILSHMTTCTNTVITNIGSIMSSLNYISAEMSVLRNIDTTLANINTSVLDISTGKMVPNSFVMQNSNQLNSTLNKLSDMLQYNQENMIDREDLIDVLTAMFKQYMNIGFYIGDEELARHANAGNKKLEQRFYPVLR